MKTHIYYFADTPPPSDFYSQIVTTASEAINWGNAVGLGIVGIMMALSIAAYLFKK